MPRRVLPAEPDEEVVLEVPGSDECLEVAVAVRNSLASRCDLVRTNPGRPLPRPCAIRAFLGLRQLDDDPARLEMSERVMRGYAVAAVPVAHGRGPTGGLHAPARGNSG